jgi:hypothetical protein
VELAGSVEMGRLTVVDPPMDPTDCPWMTQLDAHYALEPLFPVAALTADTLPSLGVLGFPELLDAVDVLVGGTVSPSPVEALGTCVVTEPSNWGDPDRPWRPCAAHLALRKSLGSLRVIGGTGQGVLVVDGDLVLDEGARFHGLVLARGALRVEGGAELVGMAVLALVGILWYFFSPVFFIYSKLILCEISAHLELCTIGISNMAFSGPKFQLPAFSLFLVILQIKREKALKQRQKVL